MVETGDDELVRACLDGDRGAFAELLARYEKPVFNVALRMLRSWEDARDVTQTAFLKAYENLSAYDSSHKFYSWIYRIAINEAINTLRRSGRDADVLDDRLAADDPGPEDAAGIAQREAVVQEALGTLTPEYRAVVVLKYFVDCSYQEIGRILDLEEKTVKSRLFTARQRLKDVLAAREAG